MHSTIGGFSGFIGDTQSGDTHMDVIHVMLIYPDQNLSSKILWAMLEVQLRLGWCTKDCESEKNSPRQKTFLDQCWVIFWGLCWVIWWAMGVCIWEDNNWKLFGNNVGSCGVYVGPVLDHVLEPYAWKNLIFLQCQDFNSWLLSICYFMLKKEHMGRYRSTKGGCSILTNFQEY